MKSSDTAERIIPDAASGSLQDYMIYLRHLTTYKFAKSRVAGKTVLDFGCGTGYGAHLLAEKCLHITGVDVSREAVEYAKRNYSRKNLEYKAIGSIETTPLPFDDNSFDAVVSFQVIEHINNDKIYLEEIHRVLKPGGVVIIATPDRSARLFSFQKPWNAYHVREYSDEGLSEVMNRLFKNVQLLKMGGDKDVIGVELKRVTKMKWLCLPFTLPFLPETIRRIILIFLTKLYAKMLSLKPAKRFQGSIDIDAFKIGESVSNSINLIAVAEK